MAVSYLTDSLGGILKGDADIAQDKEERLREKYEMADMNRAAGMKWDDFEDALQSTAAERLHVDYIITRNVRDFRKSKVIAFTPSELLARL